MINLKNFELHAFNTRMIKIFSKIMYFEKNKQIVHFRTKNVLSIAGNLKNVMLIKPYQ